MSVFWCYSYSKQLDPSHLFEHKDTVSRANELRQLCNASLVQVRPRETAVVEVDLGTAVFPVPRSCTRTQNETQTIKQAQATETVRRQDIHTAWNPSMRPET